MKSTLKDIAIATGFSINTVSRVLRKDRNISKATSELILKKAEELQYVPNALASSMRSSHSGLIGVISADSANPFFAEVIRGIEDRASEHGYQLMLANTEESVEKEEQLIKMCLSRHLDGLIIMPTYDTSEEVIQRYKNLESRIPFVFVGRHLDSLIDHSILHEDFRGQKLVFDYLLSQGHRRILYISGPTNVSNSFDRYEGMKASFKENEVEFLEQYVIPSNGHIEDGYRAVNQALNKGLEFTAVACFNDMVALGALKSLAENDLRVPQDVELFGYDNLELSQFYNPSLSTVDVPKFKLGQTAMDSLARMIKGEKCKLIELPIRLVFRGSTR